MGKGLRSDDLRDVKIDRNIQIDAMRRLKYPKEHGVGDTELEEALFLIMCLKPL